MNNHKASILIEALAAVAIISVSLLLIMQSFVGSFRATMLHQDYMKALVLLETRLDAVFAKDIEDISAPEEPCPRPLDRFRYKTKIQDLNDVDYTGLKRFDIAVTWPSGSKDKQLSLTTYLKTDNVRQETKSVFYN